MSDINIQSLAERAEAAKKEFDDAQAALAAAKSEAKAKAIERIRADLIEHIINADELGFNQPKPEKVAPSKKAAKPPAAAQKPSKKKAKKTALKRTAYTDGTNYWTGWGPVPKWLTAAMKKSKKTIDAFAVKA